MQGELKVGFSRVNITPPLGINIAGYFVERIADGVLDDLETVAVAISSEDKVALIITVDHCGLSKDYLDEWRDEISRKTGTPREGIFIHSTHTHQGPLLVKGHKNPLTDEYALFLGHRVVDASVMAIDDLKPAKMGYGIGEANNVAFIRRYRMKDGSAKTNPGVGNEDIVAPIGTTDERVSVVRFDREGAETVVLVNFANHPDVVGGNKISADWPGMTRRFTERAIENTKCIVLNGAQGDVNHVNVFPKPGDMNDMFLDFDGCSRGYGHARHIARVVTGAVMSVFDKVEYQDRCDLRFVCETVHVPSNKPTAEELVLAHKYNDLHLAGRDDLIPYEAMMLTTVVAEAGRMVRLENAPETFPMPFTVVAIGDVALVGIPGEPFTGIGRALKDAPSWKLVIPCCNVNSKEGYFPMRDSYDEGGYEARSSNFKAGSAEYLIEVGLGLLSGLK